MKRFGTFSLLGAAVVAAGAFVAGCSGGSGGGSGGGGGVLVPQVDAVGPLTSALPAGRSFYFTAACLNSTPAVW